MTTRAARSSAAAPPSPYTTHRTCPDLIDLGLQRTTAMLSQGRKKAKEKMEKKQ